MKKCKQCLIKSGTILLMDLFAVAKDTCKNNEKLTIVEINDEGLCNYCIKYNSNYDKEFIQNELSVFSYTPQNSKYHSIVALSGGKDSITALYLAVNILKLNVIAVTYDNGFIPENVIEQSSEICKKLNVPYIVKKRELYSEFKEEYKKNKDGVFESVTGIDFCQICSKHISNSIFSVAKEYNIEKAIFGNKIYTKLEPNVSCIKNHYHKNEKYNEIQQLISINLLFAMNVNTNIQKLILDEVNWKDPKLKGYTSNCLIPGFVEFSRRKKIELDPDAGYLEMELRSNMYSFDEAENLISNREYIDSSKEIDTFFDNVNINR